MCVNLCYLTLTTQVSRHVISVYKNMLRESTGMLFLCTRTCLGSLQALKDQTTCLVFTFMDLLLTQNNRLQFELLHQCLKITKKSNKMFFSYTSSKLNNNNKTTQNHKWTTTPPEWRTL